MRRFILTGTPGSGKTAILRALEVGGYAVVEEAATDVIAFAHARGDAEPWRAPSFIDEILKLQLSRLELSANLPGTVQFHDRSPICTHALCVHLGYALPRLLIGAIDRLLAERAFEKKVLFIENLGFVEPTAARRITFEESLAFERVHEDSYRRFGFELVWIPAKPLSARVADVVRETRYA